MRLPNPGLAGSGSQESPRLTLGQGNGGSSQTRTGEERGVAPGGHPHHPLAALPGAGSQAEGSESSPAGVCPPWGPDSCGASLLRSGERGPCKGPAYPLGHACASRGSGRAAAGGRGTGVGTLGRTRVGACWALTVPPPPSLSIH